mmetsp:Transcript_24012/g.44869  ORF Transcript_24012/g.44869 Transcript_24012/m.44869 type:complete len:313 (+) Transcript_24012:333-1271(+)
MGLEQPCAPCWAIAVIPPLARATPGNRGHLSIGRDGADGVIACIRDVKGVVRTPRNLAWRVEACAALTPVDPTPVPIARPPEELPIRGDPLNAVAVLRFLRPRVAKVVHVASVGVAVVDGHEDAAVRVQERVFHVLERAVVPEHVVAQGDDVAIRIVADFTNGAPERVDDIYIPVVVAVEPRDAEEAAPPFRPVDRVRLPVVRKGAREEISLAVGCDLWHPKVEGITHVEVFLTVRTQPVGTGELIRPLPPPLPRPKCLHRFVGAVVRRPTVRVHSASVGLQAAYGVVEHICEIDTARALAVREHHGVVDGG